MGMKKRGREREEAKAKKNIKIKKSLSVAMAAVLVSSVLMAFMPLAAAGGAASLVITPDEGITDKVSAYNVDIDTTGFNSLDLTIPAGFGADPPEDGDLIADISLRDKEGNEYEMTLTANGDDKIDLVCVCGCDTVEYTFGASYGEGDTIEVTVSCGGESTAKLTLPTSGADGSLELTSALKTITNVDISIKEFVENPTACGDYEFDLAVNGATDSDTVYIRNNPGDINNDGVVNVFDLQRWAWAKGSHPGDLNWDPCADMDCDGDVDWEDKEILDDNWGNIYF